MGFWEVLLILVIAFFIFGPQKVPGLARDMGKGMRWLKRSWADFNVAVNKEFAENDTNDPSWKKKKD